MYTHSKEELQEAESLLEFATEREKRYIEAFLALPPAKKSWAQVARDFDVNHGTPHRAFQTCRRRASRMGWHPSTGHTKPANPGFMLKGSSTLYDADGNAKLQWIKTKEDPAAMEAMEKAYWEAFSKDLPQMPAHSAVEDVGDVLSEYVISDTHIGMLAWRYETGEDADSDIIEALTHGGLSLLASTAKPGSAAVLQLMGDFFHYDSIIPVTARSKNVLDSDSRHTRVFETGMRLVRRMIHVLLEKHSSVRVICIPGNHDEMSMGHLRVALRHIYERDERVDVIGSHSSFQYWEWGDVGVCAHHGDKTKLDRIRDVFSATDVWCRTKHRYIQTGHTHHERSIDTPGCHSQSFRVIIPPDAHAHSHGYGGTPRDMQRLDFHCKWGRVGTAYVTPEMVAHHALGKE